jgi:hypothetical protein
MLTRTSHNDDSSSDLFVANYQQSNVFYLNGGNGKFTVGTSAAGLTSATSGFEGTFGDADGDGDLGAFNFHVIARVVSGQVTLQLQRMLCSALGRPGNRRRPSVHHTFCYFHSTFTKYTTRPPPPPHTHTHTITTTTATTDVTTTMHAHAPWCCNCARVRSRFRPVRDFLWQGQHTLHQQRPVQVHRQHHGGGRRRRPRLSRSIVGRRGRRW